MSPRLTDLFLSSQSDERLVTLARAGHERAFVAIVERYRPELHALARRLCQDGRGEDVVQQALLSAFVALRSGADVKHLRGWLYQIVRNAANRSRATRFVPLDVQAASAEVVEDVVQQRALAISALTELARLPERQRQAMVDTALGGMARADVASTMGLSEGAVRQLVHRARRTLRTAVTALTPWPLARWFAAVGPASPGAASPGAAWPGVGELAAGAGAATSGGIAVKLGTLLASGTLLTGVAAVNLHGGPRHSAGTYPNASPRAQVSGQRARPLILAATGSPALAVAASRAYATPPSTNRPLRSDPRAVIALRLQARGGPRFLRLRATHRSVGKIRSGGGDGPSSPARGGENPSGGDHRGGGDGTAHGSGPGDAVLASVSTGSHDQQSQSDGSRSVDGTGSQSHDGSPSGTGSHGDSGGSASGVSTGSAVGDSTGSARRDSGGSGGSAGSAGGAWGATGSGATAGGGSGAMAGGGSGDSGGGAHDASHIAGD